MNHRGKAFQACVRIIGFGFFLAVAVVVIGVIASFLGSFIAAATTSLFVLWVLFAGFCVYFFRDPDANVPTDPKGIVSPAHGTVDVIDEIDEPEFMLGRCRRVSIFLSVFDVHVQKSPINGRISLLRHYPGQFLNAMRSDCGLHNEHVHLGVESGGGTPAERVGMKLIAGLIARRIIPWVRVRDAVGKGERISLIQFGSRVEVHLPLSTRIDVHLGDKVVGGETRLASYP